MSDKLKKTVIGALVAIGLAIAVSYGLISQQTADQIQTKANETLQTGDAPNAGQPAPTPQKPDTQNPGTPGPAPTEPVSPNPAPAQRP